MSELQNFKKKRGQSTPRLTSRIALSTSLWEIGAAIPFPPHERGSFGSRLSDSEDETADRDRESIMPSYSPELITIMRTVLDETMTKVPLEQATNTTKAYLAEFILKAAADGVTSYDALIDAAAQQLPTILSLFM